jgi:hypothetical protein
MPPGKMFEFDRDVIGQREGGARDCEENFDWHLPDGSLRSGMAVHGPDPRYPILTPARIFAILRRIDRTIFSN